jgi:hypothetical protein
VTATCGGKYVGQAEGKHFFLTEARAKILLAKISAGGQSIC